MKTKVELKRVLMEVFGGCNYTCQMCPQSLPGRDTSFKRKLPLKNFEEILDKTTKSIEEFIQNTETDSEKNIQ